MFVHLFGKNHQSSSIIASSGTIDLFSSLLVEGYLIIFAVNCDDFITAHINAEVKVERSIIVNRKKYVALTLVDTFSSD